MVVYLLLSWQIAQSFVSSVNLDVVLLLVDGTGGSELMHL
jgi:hypothetical protein